MSDFNNRPQIEVLAAADGGRRRHWSDEDKLRIVEESFVGHRQCAATARRHGVCRSLLTIWRREYRNGELGASRSAAFSPVSVTQDSPVSRPGPVDPFEPARDAQVEIALRNGRRLVVPAELASEALVRLIQLVERA
ncbi:MULTISPECIES: IS66-like element accessory protein TnpA [Actibacterium]|uniref:Transposase n=1 Tax=Actibacterium naphthalenivorans TaxID=1614693 RepID=A0A840C5Z1_9RHOB|nr:MULTISPECIES: transposase [Actibacterium]ALG89987.1 transposase [Actibacterium sp. EMB200-NS6]MBB4020253.1 transposase [Actibacterium naphthalenivorans]